MKKLKKTLHCDVTMAAWPRTQIHVCGILTSQIRAEPVKNWKKDEHKHDAREDIEKKVDIFHILNGILAKTRNIHFVKKMGFLSINQMLRKASPARRLDSG